MDAEKEYDGLLEQIHIILTTAKLIGYECVVKDQKRRYTLIIYINLSTTIKIILYKETTLLKIANRKTNEDFVLYAQNSTFSHKVDILQKTLQTL